MSSSIGLAVVPQNKPEGPSKLRTVVPEQIAPSPVALHVSQAGMLGGMLSVGNVGGAANVLAAVTTASHADTDTAKSNRTMRVIRMGRSNPATRPDRSSCLISLSPVRLDRASCHLSGAGHDYWSYPSPEIIRRASLRMIWRRWSDSPAAPEKPGDAETRE